MIPLIRNFADQALITSSDQAGVMARTHNRIISTSELELLFQEEFARLIVAQCVAAASARYLTVDTMESSAQIAHNHAIDGVISDMISQLLPSI
jgi:hypothetical protein